MKQPILLNVPDKIDGDRIYLRSYQIGDGEVYYKLLIENNEHFKEEVDELHKFKSAEDAEVFTRTRMTEWIARSRFVPAIIRRSDNKMIGQLWLEPIDWDLKIFEIGYFISKEAEGNGFVSEAAKLGINFLFNEIGMNKVEIQCKISNKKSYMVAQRLGFTKEGTLRARNKTRAGEIQDRLYYGLLRSEWENN